MSYTGIFVLLLLGGFLHIYGEQVGDFRPTFTKGPEDYSTTLVYGSDTSTEISLSCRVANLTANESVIWIKNGIQISNGADIVIETDQADEFSRSLTVAVADYGNGTFQYNLDVSAVSYRTAEYANGKYMCAILPNSNENTIANSDIAIVAINVVPREIYPICQASYLKESYFVGDVVNLSCMSDPGVPEVNLRWYAKHSGDVLINQRVSEVGDLISADTERTLTVEDSGSVFECRLLQPGITSPPRHCQVGPFLVHERPTVELHPQIQNITSSDDEALFTCTLSPDSYHAVKYSWMIDSESFERSLPLVFTNGNGSAQVSDLTSADNGNYTITCVVSGLGTGSHHASGALVVNVPPTPPVPTTPKIQTTTVTASTTNTQPSTTKARSSTTNTPPSTTNTPQSSTNTQPSTTKTRISTTNIPPSTTNTPAPTTTKTTHVPTTISPPKTTNDITTAKVISSPSSSASKTSPPSKPSLLTTMRNSPSTTHEATRKTSQLYPTTRSMQRSTTLLTTTAVETGYSTSRNPKPEIVSHATFMLNTKTPTLRTETLSTVPKRISTQQRKQNLPSLTMTRLRSSPATPSTTPTVQDHGTSTILSPKSTFSFSSTGMISVAVVGGIVLFLLITVCIVCTVVKVRSNDHLKSSYTVTRDSIILDRLSFKIRPKSNTAAAAGSPYDRMNSLFNKTPRYYSTQTTDL